MPKFYLYARKSTDDEDRQVLLTEFWHGIRTEAVSQYAKIIAIQIRIAIFLITDFYFFSVWLFSVNF